MGKKTGIGGGNEACKKNRGSARGARKGPLPSRSGKLLSVKGHGNLLGKRRLEKKPCLELETKEHLGGRPGGEKKRHRKIQYYLSSDPPPKDIEPVLSNNIWKPGASSTGRHLRGCVPSGGETYPAPDRHKDLYAETRAVAWPQGRMRCRTHAFLADPQSDGNKRGKSHGESPRLG